MAAVVSLSFNTKQAERAFRALRANAKPAIARALNRSIGSASTVMVRGMSKDLGLKSSDVRDQLKRTEASPTSLLARLRATGKRIPLIQFRAKGPEPSRGRGRGVTARLPGGAGRYPHAFIATMKSGHRGVFARRGTGGRLPVAELRGPSLPHVFVKFRPDGLARGLEQLVKNLRSELRFAVRKSAT